MFENMNPGILFDIERGHPLSYKKFIDFKYNFLFGIMKENIERGKREGVYRAEIDSEIISRLRLESMILPFDERIFPRNKFSLVSLQRQLIEFFLFGMVTPKGYKLILKYQKGGLKKNVQ